VCLPDIQRPVHGDVDVAWWTFCLPVALSEEPKPWQVLLSQALFLKACASGCGRVGSTQPGQDDDGGGDDDDDDDESCGW